MTGRGAERPDDDAGEDVPEDDRLAEAEQADDRLEKGAEAVRTGWVNVNEGTNYWESHLPFGGRSGSRSGVGRVGGRFSIRYRYDPGA